MQIESCCRGRALCDKAGRCVDAFLDNTWFVLYWGREERYLGPVFGKMYSCELSDN